MPSGKVTIKITSAEKDDIRRFWPPDALKEEETEVFGKPVRKMLAAAWPLFLACEFKSDAVKAAIAPLIAHGKKGAASR